MSKSKTLLEQAREIAERDGWSGFDLSQATGIPEPTCYRFLRPTTTNISSENLEKILGVLGFTIRAPAKGSEAMSWQAFKKDANRKTFTVRGRDHDGLIRQLPGYRNLRGLRASPTTSPPSSRTSGTTCNSSQDLRGDRRARTRAARPVWSNGACSATAPSRSTPSSATTPSTSARPSGTPSTSARSSAQVPRVIDGTGALYWPDVEPHKVEQVIGTFAMGHGYELSPASRNAYLRACKGFANWHQPRFIARSPLAPVKGIERSKVQAKRTRQRRVIDHDQMGRLLRATIAAPERFGMTGPERALAYETAVMTALRANELAQLTVGQMLLDATVPALIVRASQAKNAKTTRIRLPRDLADRLREHVRHKAPGARVFPALSSDHTAAMLRSDLEPAEIPYRDEAGLSFPRPQAHGRGMDGAGGRRAQGNPGPHAAQHDRPDARHLRAPDA
ncbi:MAG: helix-turn-helix domain-containing protein [Phycisphaerales bacterium]|nr:helix-turn-helix domain-containing protein [Phycisphaerales bacterium]